MDLGENNPETPETEPVAGHGYAQMGQPVKRLVNGAPLKVHRQYPGLRLVHYYKPSEL